MDEVQRLHSTFMSDEEKVRKANKALEDSNDTTQQVKEKLNRYQSGGDLAPLEKKVNALSVVNLNRKVSLHF